MELAVTDKIMTTGNSAVEGSTNSVVSEYRTVVFSSTNNETVRVDEGEQNEMMSGLVSRDQVVKCCPDDKSCPEELMLGEKASAAETACAGKLEVDDESQSFVQTMPHHGRGSNSPPGEAVFTKAETDDLNALLKGDKSDVKRECFEDVSDNEALVQSDLNHEASKHEEEEDMKLENEEPPELLVNNRSLFL
jgi:hypothetical protein